MYVTERGHAYWERLSMKEDRSQAENEAWNVMYSIENDEEPEAERIRVAAPYYDDTLEWLLASLYVARE